MKRKMFMMLPLFVLLSCGKEQSSVSTLSLNADEANLYQSFNANIEKNGDIELKKGIWVFEWSAIDEEEESFCPEYLMKNIRTFKQEYIYGKIVADIGDWEKDVFSLKYKVGEFFKESMTTSEDKIVKQKIQYSNNSLISSYINQNKGTEIGVVEEGERDIYLKMEWGVDFVIDEENYIIKNLSLKKNDNGLEMSADFSGITYYHGLGPYSCMSFKLNVTEDWKVTYVETSCVNMLEEIPRNSYKLKAYQIDQYDFSFAVPDAYIVKEGSSSIKLQNI